MCYCFFVIDCLVKISVLSEEKSKTTKKEKNFGHKFLRNELPFPQVLKLRASKTIYQKMDKLNEIA